jgi:uracil-DNA glycosylase
MIVQGHQVKPVGPPNAEVMLVGEAPGAEEMQLGVPFVGASGIELSLMMGEAGMKRSDCYLTNVARTRPPGNDINNWIASTATEEAALLSRGGIRYNGRVISPEVYEGIRLLRAEVETVRPKLIIALGNTALWVLTNEWGIGSWRASQLTATLSGDWRPTCLPTYNPAGVLRQWSLRRIVVQDFRRARSILTDGLPVARYNFCVEPTFAEAISVLEFLQAKLERAVEPVTLSVDIETRNFHTACLGIAWNKTDAICIPFLDSRRPEGYWNLEEETEIVYRLYLLLTHARAAVVGQNFMYDIQYIFRYFHFIPRVVRDTMLYQHVCFPGVPKSLDFLASMYCESYRYWKDDGKTWSASMDERVLWRYNCEDCVRTFECDEALQGVARALKLDEQVNFQMRLWPAVLRMMNRGMRVDDEMRQQLEKDMDAHAASLLADITYVVGHPLNPKSPKQMKEFFYGELQLPPVYKRGKQAKPGKIRQPSCDDECLQKIRQREPIVGPLIDLITEFRSVSVYASTFLRDVRDTDGRLRCSINIAGAVTFRFSTSENAFGSGMNMQNLPGKENKTNAERDKENAAKYTQNASA